LREGHRGLELSPAELDFSYPADQFKKLDELQAFVPECGLFGLIHACHLAHRIAKESVFLCHKQGTLLDHHVQGILHRHILLSWVEIVGVQLFQAFYIRFEYIINFDTPELSISEFLPRCGLVIRHDILFDDPFQSLIIREAHPRLPILDICESEEYLEELEAAELLIGVLVIRYHFNISSDEQAVDRREIHVLIHDLAYVAEGSEVQQGDTGEVRAGRHGYEDVLEAHEMLPDNVPALLDLIGVLDEPGGLPLTLVQLRALLQEVGRVLPPLLKDRGVLLKPTLYRLSFGLFDLYGYFFLTVRCE